MKPAMTALVDRYAALSPLARATAKAQQAGELAENTRRAKRNQQALAAIAKAEKIINRTQKGNCHGR